MFGVLTIITLETNMCLSGLNAELKRIEPHVGLGFGFGAWGVYVPMSGSMVNGTTPR